MTQQTDLTRPPIAIVGLSALFPGSTSTDGFWSDILAGKDLLTDVPESHWLPEDYFDADPTAPDKTYAKRGGFLSDIDFDALHWGVPPSILEATDTSQLLALIVAEQVLRDAANGQFEDMDRSRISCILGVTSAQELLGTMVSRLQRPIWKKSLREHGLPESEVEAVCQRIADHYVPWQESSFPGLLGNVVAGRIANRLDLGGTNCVTDAACASSFSALSMAVRELYLGDSDLVITGGVDTLNDIFMFMCFSKTPALSRSGDCRPFSDQADGTMLGEGLGMVALKRLDDAERDGNRIYALLSGVGSSSDGRSKSVYAPVPTGQAAAIRRAYKNAGFTPDTVELIEAHGTGTGAGDKAEFGGLSLVFDEANDGAERETSTQWCALGTVKSQIGHTKAAAGAAGLFKAVMALHHKVLPPTIKVDQPNPALDIGSSPFFLNTEARPWIRGSDHPRRAGVSSFGFGGSNFHLAIEEYTGAALRADRRRTLPVELVALAGGDGSEVARAARTLADRAASPGMLQRIAWESAQTFDAAAQARLAVVACDEDDLAQKLRRLADLIDDDPQTGFVHPDGSAYGLGQPAGGLAFLFPGQGSQYLDMGKNLAMSFDVARGPWDRAADLDLGAKERIDQVVFSIPRFNDTERRADEDRLRSTEWAQPAIGLASLSLLALMRRLGLKPEAVAGHSFGEITALHAAGVFSEAEMLRVARRRGELMAEASKLPGTMCAVSATIEEVEAQLESLGRSDVVVANHNAPTQVVISGTVEGVDAAEARMKTASLHFKRLPVATAFHSPVVAASSAPFGEFLAHVDFGEAERSVWSGEVAAPYEANSETQRERLAQQIARPVRFVDLLQGLSEAGIRTFVEVGPGSVLSGLVGRTLTDEGHRAIALDRKGTDGVVSLSRGLAQIIAAGHPLQLAALWEGYGEPVDGSQRTAPKLAVSIGGANHGKLYPPQGGAAALPAPNPPKAAPKPPVAAASSPSTTPDRTQTAGPTALSPVSPAPTPMSAPDPAPVETAMSTPKNSPVTDGWLAAWQEAQQQSAAAHTAFQQAMAQAHCAYLNTMETSIAALAGLAGGEPLVGGTARPQPAAPIPTAAAAPILPPAAAAAPMVPPTPAIAPVLPATPAAPVLPAVTAPPPAAAPLLPAAPVLPEASAPHAASPTPSAAPGVDLRALMLEVVAEKTGYPAEMLELDMNLEGDLGIDSIKRVEILAAVEEQVPSLPEVDAAHMGTLTTLGEIVEYMQSLLGESSASAPTAVHAPPAAAAAPTPSVDLHSLMLAVVAEKTGYPAEMLELDMNLEGDLGIDSIKRVEILAAVEEQVPSLPEVDAALMGTLTTLGEIVRYMEGLLGRTSSPAAAPAPAPSTSSSAPSPAAAAAPPDDGKPELGRYALELVPSPAVGLAQPALHGSGPVHITRCGTGLADALVEELARRGLNASVAETVPPDASSVVFLGGLRPVTGADEAIAVQREAFAIARGLAPQLGESGGLFVTVQDTGGAFGTTDFPGERAYLAGLPALVKTASQEWPLASLKAIDIACGERNPKALANALADELLLGGGEVEVGLSSDGTRLRPQSVRVPVQPSTSPIGKDDVVVVSGGGRGVTAACVIEWARDTGGKFLLLGRTALTDEPAGCADADTDAELKRALLAEVKRTGAKTTPAELGSRVHTILASREIRRTLAAIEEAGGQARYCSASVTDATAIAAILDRTRSDWGPIRALVHGAGVLADRKIKDQTDAQFDRVFNTKIEGLRVLLEAMTSDPLALICLFSSVSARCGNNGQSTYAMANEVLNKVAWAESRARGTDVLVKSMGWGPWEGGMVNPQLRAHFESLGVPMIPLEVGARMFADELCGAQPAEVEVVLGGEPQPEALLVVGSESRSQCLEVALSRETHAYLAGHSINGEVVVPVALALEWFSRIARAFHPDLHLETIHDLRVLKGIQLQDFDGGGDRLIIAAKQLSNGCGALLGLELRSPSGTVHYRAQAQMVETPPPAPTAGAPKLALDDWGGAPVYGDVLFHTDEFQVIQNLDGVGANGISGTVNGVDKAEWSWDRWDTDVAALDGGLQLILLWARTTMGGAVLPMGINEVRMSSTTPPEGRIQCVAQCRAETKNKGVADVVFHTETGDRFAEFKGVEVILRPDGTKA